MDKLVNSAGPGGKRRRRLAAATVLTVTASLLVAGASSPAQADPQPTPATNSTAPTVTEFPKSADPDAAFRKATEEAKKQGQPIPVTEAFTETARHWAYPDGHLTTQSYAGPTQLKQPDGTWALINTDLVEQDGVLKPKLAKADVQFSLGGNGPFASMERNKGQRFALSWMKELPKPEITGNVARYIDAAGPSADLVVTALPTGFQHDVVLRERPAKPVEFRLPVQTEGLTLSMAKGGGLALKDAKGKTTLSAPAPRMWDAAATDPSDKQSGREAKVKTSVETKDGQTVLVLKPDPAWLADPATQYPVTVDPTTTLGITQEVGIMSPNSQIAPGRVGRQNYRYCTGTWPNQTCTNRPETLRALMAFDTTPITNRHVVKATMQLTLRTNASSCLVNYQSIFAHRITNAWVANDTFWSRQPATTAEGRSSINPCIQPQAAGAVWSWDLTPMTQAWAGGTANHGLMLQLGTETTPASNASENFDFYAQAWGQNVPKLSVDWVLPPEIPTVAAESIDSLNGTDAIARSTAVKVTYKSSVPEATPLDYTVSVNDSTMAPPPAQLPTDEAAYWKLDETSGTNAADASGHGLNATLTGNYSRVPGQVGQALKLSGGSGTTSGPALNTNQSYTVTAWVKLEDSTTEQVIFSQQGANQPAFTLAYARSTVPEVDQRWILTMVTQDVPNTIYEQWAVSKNIARVGRWSHLAVQYDQTAHKIRLFVDGELADERDHTVNWNARGAFQFGKGQIAGDDTPFTGAIDDVHAYQRVLSPADLRTMVTAPGTTTNNNVPANQTPERIFSLDNPASFKFVVKACRTGIVPPSCNESPAYRITSDAAMLPTETETGMADPTQPILSGMVNRPSGAPALAKFYLYDNAGTPIGAAPLGIRTVNGGERASFQIPADTVQPGTAYKWQMVACASGQTAADEVCTSKTTAASFTTPGTPPPPPVEDVRHVTLGKDNFVIKTAKTGPTACNGAPCIVTDDTVMRIGGIGTDRTATVIGFRLNELPDGSAVSEGILKLGSPLCPAGQCPDDAVITATPLKSPVTNETKGSDLSADADTATTPYSLPIGGLQADIAGSEYQWMMLTSNKDEVITLADPTAAEQPSLALTYLPPGPPSKVLSLAAQAGDTSAIASWGLPESNGSVAMLDGYDIEVSNASGTVVKTLDVKDPHAAITGLANGEAHIVKVRAKTAFGTSDWESTAVTPKAVPPPPAQNPTTPCIPYLDTPPTESGTKAADGSGAQEYINQVRSYYEAHDAVLEGRATDVWNTAEGAADTPLSAMLAIGNPSLTAEFVQADKIGVARSQSTVTLTDVVVYEDDRSQVRVRAVVNRTWNLTVPASGETAEGAASSRVDAPGKVYAHKGLTSVVTAFNRCGEMIHFYEEDEIYEDPSDFWDKKDSSGGCGAGALAVRDFAAHQCAGGGGKLNPPGVTQGSRYSCTENDGDCAIDSWGKDVRVKGIILEARGYTKWQGAYGQNVLGPDQLLFRNLYARNRVTITDPKLAKDKKKSSLVKKLRLKLKISLDFTMLSGEPSISYPPGVSFPVGSSSKSWDFDADPGVRDLIFPAQGPYQMTLDCRSGISCAYSGFKLSVNAQAYLATGLTSAGWQQLDLAPPYRSATTCWVYDGGDGPCK
ncbi:LamG-like jellyroll fold domain-containing protein [Nonomuraea dietziae]|uniref:LamG-like jellyroll fold domain-containing protein n=1 Tax=Nonomuraea dietziae TaxID=65515 RepID=UPI0033D68662